LRKKSVVKLVAVESKKFIQLSFDYFSYLFNNQSCLYYMVIQIECYLWYSTCYFLHPYFQ